MLRTGGRLIRLSLESCINAHTEHTSTAKDREIVRSEAVNLLKTAQRIMNVGRSFLKRRKRLVLKQLVRSDSRREKFGTDEGIGISFVG